MSVKAQVEAIIYAAEEPVTLDQMASLLKDAIAAEEGFGLEDADARQRVKARLRQTIMDLTVEYAATDHAIEVREIAGGWRMATKPEHHDTVRAFAKNLKPPVRLSLQALETLAVIAYKQPITVPEISEIRGVDSSGVIGTLLDRKLITTAGRKAVIGRPILYKTTKEFLLRFGLSDLSELPSMEEFEKLAGESLKGELFEPVADATGVPDAPTEPAATPEPEAQASDEVQGAEDAQPDNVAVINAATEPDSDDAEETKQSLSEEPVEAEKLASPPSHPFNNLSS
jgi:segregation and condensation protein B